MLVSRWGGALGIGANETKKVKIGVVEMGKMLRKIRLKLRKNDDIIMVGNDK